MSIRSRSLPLVGLALIASVLGACGGDDANAAPADCTPVNGGQVTLVARNIQWDKNCFKVPESGEVDFTVKLEDEDVQHDLQVFGQGIKEQTPLEAGPTTQQLVVDFKQPGYYQFVCTIHSNMEGQIYIG